MAPCKHYMACWRHRGGKCEVCGGFLLWVDPKLAPMVARCHP